jgi:PAS domain S-box-containing protein
VKQRWIGLVVLFIAMLALLAGDLIVATLANRGESAIATAEQRRFESYTLADELRQSSDDLTRMARTFVVTGDPRFEEYFRQILAIREGLAPRPIDYGGVYWDFVTATGEAPHLAGDAAALQELMRDIGFSEDEFLLLSTAMAESDALAAIEERAMNAVKGIFPDEDGSFTIAGAPDPELARELMYSADYHDAKAQVMAPIDDFLSLIDERTATEVALLRARGEGLRALGFALLLATALLVFVALAFGGWQAAAAGRRSAAVAVEDAGDEGVLSAWPIALAALTVAVAIATLAWWNQAQFERQKRADLATELSNVLDSTSQGVEHWIDNREDEALIWGNLDEVREDLEALLRARSAGRPLVDAPEQARLRKTFAPLLEDRSYEGFLLLSEDGSVLASDRDARIGRTSEDLLAPESLAAVLGGPRYSAVHLPVRTRGESTDGPSATVTMFVVAAVRNHGETSIGALALEIDPHTQFSEVLHRRRFGRSGESYAFNRSGRFISKSRFTGQLRELGLIQPGEETILNLGIRDPGANLAEGEGPVVSRDEMPLTLMARTAVAGHDGTNLDGYNDYRGVPVIGAWEWNATHGYGIATEIDVEEAYAPLYSTRRLSVVAAAFSVGLVIALTGLFLWMRIRMARAQAELQALVHQVQQQATELENVSSIICRWGPDGRIRFMNDYGCELFGYSSDELLGQPIVGTIVPDRETERRNVQRMIDEIAADPSSCETDEAENIRKNGDPLWVAWRNKPILNADGSLREILTIGIDITERRRAEHETTEQKQLLETTLESLTHPFYVIDANDYSIRVANSAARALGASGATTCHALSHDRDTPCDGEDHPCPLIEVKRTGRPVTVEHVHPDSERNPRHVEVHGYPIFDTEGNVVQMIEYSLDITERKRFEAELQRSEERFRTIVSNIPGVVYRCLMDDDWTMLHISDEIENLSGYPAKDFLGDSPKRSFASILHPDDIERIAENAARAVKARVPYTNEYRVIDTKGMVHWVYAKGQAIYDEEGNPLCLDGAIFDVTDKKTMELQLHDARDAAEAANRAKSTFLANMSHELRTPMNAIIGYSEMLAEDAEDEGHEEMIPDLSKINAAGKHLLALINDILDLSKIEAGRMDLYLERFDLRQMLDEAAATVAPLVTTNENRLVTDFGDDLGSVRADLTKLRQAMFNLLSNAAKFTRNGTITLAATRESREGGDWVSLSVTDTGIGIGEDKLEHVFEEFSQADGSTTRDFGGTGLGLPISRRFCRMMGGDITVSSEPGVGSTFTIELPAQVDALEAAKASIQADRREAPEVEPGVRPILVIDDDADSQDLLQRTLQAEGYAVVTASSGEEGLELAGRLRPSLITLDVMMPGMDGWAVLQQLKADPELRQVPVMMVTIIGDKGLGYTLGAVDYLTKPVDRDALRRSVKQLVAPSGAQHALVVDDDENIRSMLRRALEADGWSVAVAENGSLALGRVAERRPDLVLLDLMMPVMDGFEFVLHFRNLEGCSAVPIIAVTAKDLSEEERQRLVGGVERIVAKGALSRDQLLDQVRDLVGRRGLPVTAGGGETDPAGTTGLE